MQTHTHVAMVVLLVLGAACESDVPDATPKPSSAALYITSTVVSTDESANTYVNVLDSLDSQKIDTSQALEASGWSDVSSHAGQLFVADGESLTMKRFEASGPGQLEEAGTIDFSDHGVVNANSTFVGRDKAYAYGDEIVIWNPRTLKILRSSPTVKVADRDNGMEFSGAFAGRGMAMRDHRAYYAGHWANWEDYELSEDSLIIVVDTDKDEVIDTIEVPCPYLDFATIDEDDTIYFSNWTYSVSGTLLHGKRKSCAVRLLAGKDEVDQEWSLTFADVTDGREAAALSYVGNRKAMISVFHDEQVEIDDETTMESLADSANWRSWLVDVDTLEASQIDDIGMHSGGYASASIDGRSFVLIPNDGYVSTSVYEITSQGKPELRWTTNGWSTVLLKLR